MAIKLIANYAKRLGLPGYSSHQFSVSVETELTDVAQAAEESAKLYQLLQGSVDEQINNTGFVPPMEYGINGSNGHANGHGHLNGHVNHANGNGHANGYANGNGKTNGNGHLAPRELGVDAGDGGGPKAGDACHGRGGYAFVVVEVGAAPVVALAAQAAASAAEARDLGTP